MDVSPQNVSLRLRGSPSPRRYSTEICGKPAAVESCKTDDGGKAVHEECCVLKLKLEQGEQGRTVNITAKIA
jgi:hypothetical protein